MQRLPCSVVWLPDYAYVWRVLFLSEWTSLNINKFQDLRGCHKMELLSSDQPYPQLFPTTCYLDTLEQIIQKEKMRFNCYFAILMNKCHFCSSSIYFHNVRQSFNAKSEFHYQQEKKKKDTSLILNLFSSYCWHMCGWQMSVIINSNTVFQRHERACHFTSN